MLSIDSAVGTNNDYENNDELQAIQVDMLTHSCLPPHRLRLKINAQAMLIRNTAWICNSTLVRVSVIKEIHSAQLRNSRSMLSSEIANYQLQCWQAILLETTPVSNKT